MTDVVVLAGGKNSAEMRAATGVENRALVQLGEKTMLEWVTDALRQTTQIKRLFVVGDVPSSENYQQIAPGETLMDNLLAGLDAVGGDTPVLISTADIPFLTPAAVSDFLTQAAASEADFGYSIIPMESYRRKFPELKRTTLKLREGEFTGGNLMLVNARFLRQHRATVGQAYAARKSIGKMGKMLGWGLLGRIVVAQTFKPSILTLAALEAGASRVLGNGCRARAIVTSFAEIGTDIDRPEEIVIARERLTSR